VQPTAFVFGHHGCGRHGHALWPSWLWPMWFVADMVEPHVVCLCVQCAASQEVVEEHIKPVRRREDTELSGSGLCPSPLQANTAVRHG